jgi:hypothetical protein
VGIRAKLLVGVLGLWPLVPGCGGATHARPAVPGSLRIEKLSGSVVKLDPSAAYAPLWVRLRATVCVRSPLAAYPDAIGVTHFVVSKSRRRWWPARSVVDHAPALVPLGETWHGKSCGPVLVQDPIPSDHYGVESLGNELSCYGVELTIEVGSRHASRRAIIRCGGLPR